MYCFLGLIFSSCHHVEGVSSCHHVEGGSSCHHVEGGSSCHHVVMSSCRCVIMSMCHHVDVLSAPSLFPFRLVTKRGNQPRLAGLIHTTYYGWVTVRVNNVSGVDSSFLITIVREFPLLAVTVNEIFSASPAEIVVSEGERDVMKSVPDVPSSTV